MSDASLIYDEIAARMNDAWRAIGNGAGRSWPVAEAIGLPRLIHPFLRIDYIWTSDDLRGDRRERRRADRIRSSAGQRRLSVAR